MSSLEIILSDKREGITSFSSLSDIKKSFPKKTKVGHAGTLDKFASGLMVILVGNATKLNPIFSSFDKSYIASIRFGRETDTLDPEGRVVMTSGIPGEEEARLALSNVLGESMQEPPVYSAIHVDGKRSYRQARKNKDVRMPLRPVKVYAADFISYSDGLLKARFSVSKGTYIRSLARDAARSIGKAAHLEALRRISIGPYSIDDVGKHDSISLLRMTDLFSDVMLDEKYKKQIDNGYIPERAILSDSDSTKKYKFFHFASSLYAIGEDIGGKVRIICRF